jgi:Skp family chaperone for outer membrane proteins
VGTHEGDKLFKGLTKQYEPKKNELQQLNSDIENLKKQLNQSSGSERSQLLESIGTRQKTLKEQTNANQEDYQNDQNKIARDILQKMAPVIDKYAKANGYSILFDSSNPWPQSPLLWATAATDITKTIIHAYDNLAR